MDRLLAVAVLTALIHLINTLIYSVRVAGVRTGRPATAMSLFNIVFLISSTANLVQGPLLATMVEGAIHKGGAGAITGALEREMAFPPRYFAQIGALAEDFRLVMLSAAVGTVLGAALMTTFTGVFARSIDIFEKTGSISKMLYRLLFLKDSGDSAPAPPGDKGPGSTLRTGLPVLFLAANILVTGIFTTGVLSALFAGALYPGYRASATMLASLVNGVAQVLFATVVDPAAARITDQALRGERDEAQVGKMALYLAGTRLLGTILAQAIFVPAAYLIRFVAVFISQG
jgi:hypothetical protein